MKNKSISQACEEALEKLDIPLFRNLRGAELDDLIYSWRQRRYNYEKPEKQTTKKLSFAPPSLSPAQSEVLGEIKKVQEGVRFSAQEIGASISTFRSLAKKGYIEGGGAETSREEEVWKIAELKS